MEIKRLFEECHLTNEELHSYFTEHPLSYSEIVTIHILRILNEYTTFADVDISVVNLIAYSEQNNSFSIPPDQLAEHILYRFIESVA